MTTLADLTADIADDIDDTTGEYGDAILKAVQAAQRYCERKTYYFNETRDVTFDTVADQEWYDETDNANIASLVRIRAAYIEDSAGNVTDLIWTDPGELEVLSDNTSATGEPTNYTYFGQRIRLYPIPTDDSWTIRLQIGPYRLGALTDPTDNNAWLDEAYDLIKGRAKYILGKNTLKDAELAAEGFNDWKDQHEELKAETSSRNGTGYVRPTQF